MNNNCKKNLANICFIKVILEQVKKGILKSNQKEACQNSDIPTKAFKANIDISSKFVIDALMA